MAFDFNAIIKAQTEIVSRGIPKLICLAGVRGSGKSSALGTLPKDKKGLLVQCASESHSYISARGLATAKYGSSSHITPFDLDSVNGQPIVGDAVIGRLLELLNDEQLIKHYNVVMLDSLGAIDEHVAKTTEVMSADKFSQTKAIRSIYDRIFSGVRKYLAKGGMIIYTLPLDTYNDENGVTVSTPRIRGTGAITAILGETPVIAIAACNVELEDDKIVRDYVLSFDGSISKSKAKIVSMSGSGKDMKIKAVPQMINCNCRITGLPADKIPSCIPNDLEVLLKLIETA